MARGERDGSKERFWRDVLEQWQESEQSVREFCDERGLKESCFYAWRRTIAQRAEQVGATSRASSPTPLFLPVQVMKAASGPSLLEVVLAPGRVIRVPPDFDADALRRLVAVLEEAPSC